ncbi:MAG: ABC transporter permease [Bacteroidota bacterium]
MKNKDHHYPPKWVDRLLKAVMDSEMFEEIHGDLYEAFDYRLQQSGRPYATLIYFLDVIRYFRPLFLKKTHFLPNIFSTMNANYWKVAWRHMRQNRIYTTINLLGLAVGIVCTVFITLFTLDELSYDTFHSHADRIIRIVETQSDQEGNVAEMAQTYGALTPVLQNEFPNWEYVSRVLPENQLVSRGPDKRAQEDRFFYVDSTFLDIFDFPLIAGDKTTALDAPFSLLLTASSAKKYFGTENPVGEILTVRSEDGTNTFKITGVLENVPANSHIQFDFLASYSSLRTIMPWVNNWNYPPLYTYALLPPQADFDQVRDQLAKIPKKYLRQDLADSRQFFLQKLTDIHLRSQREGELSANGDIAYIYVFGAIAFFILLIACINFMNLSTALSIKRSKEVGMRKVMGAQRSQLIRQFIGESLIMTVIAMCIAALIIWLALPYFNEFTGKSLELSLLNPFQILLIILGLILGVGLLSGSYPAFYLSGFMPTQVLKGVKKSSHGSEIVGIRKGLVIFQFALSSGLIIGTAIIYNQMDFLRNKNLGFDKEQLILVKLRDEDDQIHIESLRKELPQFPNILAATASSGIPAKGGYHGFIVTPKNAKADSLSMATNFINDYDYVSTMGMEVLAGRDFSEDFSTDAQRAFLINEAAAEKLGWENPINQELTLTYYYKGEIQKSGKVVGMVKDFHFNSLHKRVDPVIMHVSGPTYYTNMLIIRAIGADLPGTLEHIEKKWTAFNPNRPFEYEFMDEVFDALYRKEESLAKVTSVFSLLAVCIACLGLFGLAAFTAEQRTKEVGIRKVLGASATSIIALMSWDFLKLVLIAFVLSLPLSYYFMQDWLKSFAYRVTPGLGIFLFSGLVCLAIAFLTVSSQAYRASQTNLVDALRNE